MNNDIMRMLMPQPHPPYDSHPGVGCIVIDSGGSEYSRGLGLTIAEDLSGNTCTNYHGGRVEVTSGGNIRRIDIKECGEAVVTSGGYCQKLYINDLSKAEILSGGTVSSAFITSNSKLFLLSGGTCDEVWMHNTGVPVMSGGMIKDSLEIWGDTFSHISGVHPNYVRVYGSSACLDSSQIDWGVELSVWTGTVLNLLENGGEVNLRTDGIYSVQFLPNVFGGTFTHVSSSWYDSRCCTIHSNTVASGARWSGDGAIVEVYDGGRVESAYFDSGAECTVSSGGIATDIVCVSSSGVGCSGGTVSNVLVSGGGLGGYLGGIISGVTIESGYLGMGNACAKEVILNHGHINMSGGTLSNALINSGTSLAIDRYGPLVELSGVTMTWGGEIYSDDDNISGTIKEAGGALWPNTIYSSSPPYITFLPSVISGNFSGSHTMTAHNGTVVSNANFDAYGELWVYSGGVARSCNMGGGDIVVWSGGLAGSITLGSGGSMRVHSGAAATAVGTIIHVSSGGGSSLYELNNSASALVYDGGSFHVV